jgi:methylmalonyl-CoA mutase cobalamin-binding subunit
VTPYSDTRIIAQDQIPATIAALRAAGGTKVIVQDGSIPPEAVAQLEAAGFVTAQVMPEAGLYTLEDARSPGG